MSISKVFKIKSKSEDTHIFLRLKMNICPDVPTLKWKLIVWELAKRYTGINEIKHSHGSDRWRHGCRRRALRDEFMACHWNESAYVKTDL